MDLGTLLPKQAARLCLNSVKPSNRIAEQQRMLVTDRRRKKGRSNRTCRLKRPLDATGFRAERLYPAAGASHKHVSIEDCGLREGDDVAVESVSPFQSEFRNLRQSEACRVCRLIACIGDSR